MTTLPAVGAPSAAWTDVAALLRHQRKVARLSLRGLARLTNVSDSYLSQLERGLYQPSPDVLKVVAEALGIAPAVLYERLGWLEPATGSTTQDATPGADDGVEQAIARDPRLTEEQKDALRAMYRALVGSRA